MGRHKIAVKTYDYSPTSTRDTIRAGNVHIVPDDSTTQTTPDTVRFELDIHGLTDNNTSDTSGNNTKARVNYRSTSAPKMFPPIRPVMRPAVVTHETVNPPIVPPDSS